MIKDGFFPTIIYAEDFQLDTNQLAQNIIQWSKENEGIKKTNLNGWHSETNMHEKPEYKPLVDELFRMMHRVWQEEWLDQEPVLGNMWANINPPGGYNRPHVHPNSHFSGVYYIKAPQNSGQIIFNEPRATAHMVMPRRKQGEPPPHLWREVRVNPLEGRIIIFPAWLWHCVDPNESNDIRISVSFNFIHKGFNV